MFENEIKFITEFSLSKLKKLGAYFTFENILSTELHPCIKNYISAELSYLINEDRKKLLSSSIFDYKNKAVLSKLEELDNNLKRTKSIAYEDLKDLVLQAVAFYANYLVRPKWSLHKLIYNDSEVKSADEIKLMLNYIYYHEYFKTILLKYFTQINTDIVTSDKFEELITKIDSSIIEKDFPSFIDISLSSFKDFFSIGNVNKSKIPIKFVAAYLKEKNLVDSLLRIEKASLLDTGKEFEIKKIKDIIFSKDTLLKEADIDKLKSKIQKENEVKPLAEENKIDETHDEITATVKEDKITITLDNAAIQEENLKNNVTEKTKIELENKEDETDIINKESIGEVKNDELDIEKKLLEFKNEEQILNLFDEEFKALSDNEDDSKDDDSNIDFDMLNNYVSDTRTDESKKLNSDFLDEDERSYITEKTQVDKSNITNDEHIIEDKSVNKKNEKIKENIDQVNLEQQIEEKDKSLNNIVEPETAPPQKTRENDLFYYLEDDEIEKIVNTVFNDDREDFAVTLEKVEECNSYEEAYEIMKSVFISYRVNMFTKDATTLNNAIKKYFQQNLI